MQFVVFWENLISLCSPLLVHVDGCAIGEGLGVGGIEGVQVNAVVARAGAYGHDGAQQFAVLSGEERGGWELVPACLLAQVTYLPDKLVVSLALKP